MATIQRLGSVAAAGHLRSGLRARMVGPGGYYNLGNALCLGVSLALPVLVLAGRDDIRAGALIASISEVLVGNPASVMLTAATAVFFWAGEAYHRAWSHGAPPDARLNRRGDLLSGVGAVLLGAAMMGFGQPVLAASAGLVQAVGKLGSAAGLTSLPGWPAGWPDPFRTAPLASRIPALLASLIGLVGVLAGPAPSLIAALGPASLVVSLLLWARADLMLFVPPAGQGSRQASATQGAGRR